MDTLREVLRRHYRWKKAKRILLAIRLKHYDYAFTSREHKYRRLVRKLETIINRSKQ